jgi:hypothetical protein
MLRSYVDRCELNVDAATSVAGSFDDITVAMILLHVFVGIINNEPTL